MVMIMIMMAIAMMKMMIALTSRRGILLFQSGGRGPRAEENKDPLKSYS